MTGRRRVEHRKGQERDSLSTGIAEDGDRTHERAALSYVRLPGGKEIRTDGRLTIRPKKRANKPSPPPPFNVPHESLEVCAVSVPNPIV